MTRDFPRPASRQQRHQRPVRRQAVLFEKLFAWHRRPDNSRQWMVNVIRSHSPVSKKRLLEREDAQQPRNVPSHTMNTALPPCPDLWSHQINHGYPHLPELGSEPQVKVRTVGQDRQSRFPLGGRPLELLEL